MIPWWVEIDEIGIFLGSTVDGSEIRFPTTWDGAKTLVNGKNYQLQLVNAGFLPSTVSIFFLMIFQLMDGFPAYDFFFTCTPQKSDRVMGPSTQVGLLNTFVTATLVLHDHLQEGAWRYKVECVERRPTIWRLNRIIMLRCFFSTKYIYINLI